MADVAHVLGRPEIREDVLHILIVVCRSVWTESSLVVDAAVRSLHAHAPDATRRNEVKTQLARLHELHVAKARSGPAAHLLLARHNCRVTVHAV